MPYTLSSATIWIEYACKCGSHGTAEIEGDPYVGNTFGIHGFNCPECGRELFYGEDYEEDEEDEKESE